MKIAAVSVSGGSSEGEHSLYSLRKYLENIPSMEGLHLLLRDFSLERSVSEKTVP